MEQMLELLGCYVNDKRKIKEVFRLGKVKGRRPIKVRLSSEGMATEVLKKAKELREYEKYQRVYVEKDLAYKEREMLKELRRQMYENRKKGMYSIIKNGELICKPFLKKN